jgi:hypothetical protein
VTPSRPAPARPAATTTAPTPPVAPTRFVYATAPATFDVATEGTVETEGDSAAPLHVATTTRVTLSLGAGAPGDDARPVAGTVDAFATPGGRATPTALHLPMPVTGTLDARRHRVTLALAAPQPADTACLAPPLAARPGSPPPRPTRATPALSLLATARELLLTPPPALDAGTRWDEQTESVECRGLVPVTTRTKYHYEVRGPATFAGTTTAVRVARTSESESRGELETGGHTVHVNASTHGTFDLYLDPVSGRYLGGTGQSEGTLDVDAGDGRPRRFVQRFTTRIGTRTRSATR